MSVRRTGDEADETASFVHRKKEENRGLCSSVCSLVYDVSGPV